MMSSIRALAPAWSTATAYKLRILFPSGTKQQQMNVDDWPKVLEGEFKEPTHSFYPTPRTFFIPRQEVPKGKIVTYERFVVKIRPNKTETYRFRLAVGCNLIQYPGDVSTPSDDLTTSKCLWSSTISTEGATYMCLDVKNFYLGTPMDSFEYMRIPIKLIPQEIILQYNLLPFISDVHVYIEVQKGMCGLPQTGILANQLLDRCLAIHGYPQTKFTLGLWRHVTRPIQFTLVVDDFGVQYVGKEHAQHLIDALETDYKVSKYWTGGIYCGINMKWDYENKHVNLSMHGYIKDALHKFQHPVPKRPQYAQHNDRPRLWPTHPTCITP
jgi:hypothetical protein